MQPFAFRGHFVTLAIRILVRFDPIGSLNRRGAEDTLTLCVQEQELVLLAPSL